MKQCIVIGVTGGVAAFKTVQLVSDLIKMDYDVEVIMTKNATEFIRPLQFEALTNHTVMVDTFDSRFEKSTQHISIAKKAACFMVVPATANFIAKVANGICDDMLTTTFLACDCPKIIAPAMNTNMLNNPATQRNIEQCKKDGIRILESESGYLACGDTGKGKLCSLQAMKDSIQEALYPSQPLKGKKVLISAGATMEPIDPVRYITNHSTGKMGIALATMAKRMGAEVTVVCGHLSVEKPSGIKYIDIKTTHDMAVAIQSEYEQCDICIMAAAISDYRIKEVAENKIKKHDNTLSLELVKTEDVLFWCGQNKKHQKLVGFAMETENLIQNAKEKCIRKNCDFLVANSLKQAGAGFGSDTNIITILTSDSTSQYSLMSKEECAEIILRRCMEE